MLKRVVAVTGWFAVVSSAAWGQSPTTAAPGDLDGVNPEWLKITRQNMDQQAELLAAAYELDETVVAALRAEMLHRLVAQVEEERAYQREKLDYVRMAMKLPGRAVPAEERRAFLLRMKAWLEAMPLNEQQVAGWLEQQMPAEVAARGRRRLEELWQRRDRQREAFVNDARQKSGARTRSLEGLKAETAALSEAGKPLPGGRKQAAALAGEAKKTDLARPVAPNKAVAPVPDAPKAPTKIDTSRPRTIERGGDKPTSTTGPAEPPLDEWDKYVAEAARKYAFTDAQIAKARANLADMKNRANEYRRSHADDYAKADSIADAELRAERLQRLDGPIAAFFEELKARLASLPTLEQKQKAEGGR